MATRAKPALPGSDLPFARLTKTGKLSCTGCRKRTEPRLIEPGYIVTHTLDLQALAEGRWEATGWDGSSSKVSEGGDYLALECPNCFKEYQLPKGAELEWK